MNEILNNLNVILDEFTLEQLHFLRAQWFYAFIPLLLFLLLSLKKQRSNKNWKSIIDPQLMPFVLSPSGETRQRRYPMLLVLIAASLGITALAGPVYKKLPQPVYQEKSSLVVLLDLSQSMNATDVKPSRLSRAKLELLDILKARKTGQTALIVYAADAFVVTPLTDDNATIANMVPSLETDMMPAQGSNFSAALAKAVSLFSQAGVINGDILAITDDIRQKDERAIQKINSQGHRLSLFGIGSPAGGPIPLDGGFLQDGSGAIVIAKLDTGKLQNYALQAGGLYTGLKADDRDIDKLTRLFQSREIKQESRGKNASDDPSVDQWTDQKADQWREEGYWLILPLLLLSALWARRGWLTMVSFMVPLIMLSALGATPQAAYASEQQSAPENNTAGRESYLDSEYLWATPDQKAMKSFNAGDNESAAEQFRSPEWKASAFYRQGDYQAAVDALKDIESSDAYYNKGNALAKLARYQEAIDAYDHAIELNEDNKDAAYNREQVQQALKKQDQSEQEQSEQDQSDEGESESNKSDQDESEQEKSDKDQDSSEQKSEQNESQNNDSSQQGENQEGQQQDENDDAENKSNEDQQKPSDQQSQQAEDEELKQRDAQAEAKQQEQEKQQYEKDAAERNQDEKNTEENNDQKKPEDRLENEPADDQADDQSDKKPAEIEVNPVEASITEQEKAAEQWLKRIPDDPGGLLRRKFLYQYQNIPNQQDSDEPW
ncbi:MAG: VWA domain-containing protein [Proteobacteria bacterium]|nr:VWA domain-containing protein [Pseudomonadota bacterium]